MDFDILDEVAASRGINFDAETVQYLIPDQVREAHKAAPYAGGTLPLTPRWPVVVDALSSPVAARAVASVFGRIFPPDHEVLVLTTDDDPPEGGEGIPLREIASLEQRVRIAISPPLPVLDAHRDPHTLQHIVARLRAPGGCPWDRKQTNRTLRDALVDEVYEAVDAINADDMKNLAEELGDLFLLIAMHAQIARETGQFTLEDVYEGIATKIIRRHPHVFGELKAERAEDVVGLWQQVKTAEKANGKRSTKAADGQPHAMPALERASRVLRNHPLDGEAGTEDTPGDRLLAAIAGIIDDGEDPDTVLREALARHVAESDRNNS